MNKDKIIKDLKERNEKLSNQYRLRDIRCVHLESENEDLQQRIDKAIEYIKIYRSYENIDGKDYLKSRDEIGSLGLFQVDGLLEILGGKE